jgi:hypothetical protein
LPLIGQASGMSSAVMAISQIRLCCHPTSSISRCITGNATKPPIPAAIPIEAMAESRFSAGARRPMVPTSDVTPVPLTPMPIKTPLIRRSALDVAAYIK